MNEAIGQILSFGVGVAVSPVPIIGVVLMLATPRARSNGLAFLLGWLAGLTLAGGIVLLISGGSGTSDDGDPATWTLWLEVVLGVLLLLVGVKQWRGRPREGETAALPKWMATIDSFSPAKALAFGVLLSGLNPKNLLLTVGAAAAIAQAGVSGGQEAVALAVFVVIGTLGVGAPIVIYFALGERSQELLGRLKTWMADNNAVIMCVLLGIIGVKLLGDGISGF